MDDISLPEKKVFYAAAYTLEELADLVNLEMGEGVEDEITAVRIAVRRALLKMEAEMETAEFAKMISLVFKGAGTVAGLLRTRRAISGDAADGLMGAVAQAIQELKIEQDWQI